MDLMGSLREPKEVNKASADAAESVNSGAKQNQPPSFYEAEMTKWKGKFSKAVEER